MQQYCCKIKIDHSVHALGDKVYYPYKHYFTVHIYVRRLGIYAESRKIGWFMFPANIFSARISGRTLSLVYLKKSNSVGIFERGRQISNFSNNVLEHSGETYRIEDLEENGSILPALIKESDRSPVARSNGDGTLEYNGVPDPVLIAFSAMVMCFIRVAGTPMKFTMKPEYLRILFSSSKASLILPLSIAMTFSTVLFVLLAIRFNTGFYANLLILGYGIFMISITTAMILTQIFRKAKFSGSMTT